MTFEALAADRFIALKQMGVSRETELAFDRFVALLSKWQKITDLISPASWPCLWTRHIADSAQLLNICPDPRIWVDLGSGAGFPGVIIAIMLKSHVNSHVTLIESDTRKAAFLREAIRVLELTATVCNGRIADVLPSLPMHPDIISARALAPMKALVKLTKNCLEHGSVGLFLKGATVREEMLALGAETRLDFEFFPSITSHHGRIVRVCRIPL